MAENDDNVIKVDFAQQSCDTDKVTKWTSKAEMTEGGDAEMQVFYLEEDKIIGMEFNQPVTEFRLGKENVHKFVNILTQCIFRMEEEDK